MNRNIKIKAAVIVAVILVCIYGIIGIPKSKDELVANWKKNIHLGLDLSGGTQLVMQVQLQDAFKAFADTSMDRLKEEFKKDNIAFGAMDRNDPGRLEDADKIEIDIKGVTGAQTGVFRSTIADQFSEWVLTPVNVTDYKLTLKPTEALKLKHDTMTQTMATIERKINGLGLAESSVQPTGRSDAEAELLVQLPGVDDPAHVKQLLQTQAVLEWDEVKDGPFTTREEGLTKHGGVLPLNTKLVPTVMRGGQQSWYLVSRSPIVRGTDIRDASAAQDQSVGRWETNFVLTQEAARRFERYTEANIGNRAAIVVDGQVISAPTIQSRISDTGRITGAANQEEAGDLSLNL
ncbi:MAG: protein translocase subunit SecD, partial [Bryobacteraceae bacterium]